MCLFKLYKYKTELNPSHCMMYPHGGNFQIGNKDIYNFYKDYTTLIQNGECIGMLEKPLDMGPMIL